MENRQKETEKLDLSVFAPRKNVSVPNIISVFRLLLIPVIFWLYFTDHIWMAVAVVAISGVSDGVDGYIARRYDQITPLGKVLDPIADKLTQIALALCLVSKFPAVIPLVVLLVVKELLMLWWGLRLLKTGQPPFSALWWGKASTLSFYVGALVIMVFGDRLGSVGVNIITAFLGVLLLFSMICYGMTFRQKRKDEELAR